MCPSACSKTHTEDIKYSLCLHCTEGGLSLWPVSVACPCGLSLCPVPVPCLCVLSLCVPIDQYPYGPVSPLTSVPIDQCPYGPVSL
ncbi:unnamed protein product [Boreogadus saida]